ITAAVVARFPSRVPCTHCSAATSGEEPEGSAWTWAWAWPAARAREAARTADERFIKSLRGGAQAGDDRAHIVTGLGIRRDAAVTGYGLRSRIICGQSQADVAEPPHLLGEVGDAAVDVGSKVRRVHAQRARRPGQQLHDAHRAP